MTPTLYRPTRITVDELSAFFFQAEDGIRDVAVTGVQTCALPISPKRVEIVTIVNGPLVPHTEKQRQLLGLRMAQIIRGHRAEGRNPRASSHEHGILGDRKSVV